MRIKLISVRSRGDASEEYVMLKIIEDCNLKNYIVMDNTYDPDGKLSNKVRHVYNFPDFEAEKGQYICLKTKKGKYKLGNTSKGNPLHYFYWGLEHSIWNDDGDVAHLVRISGHQALKVQPE